MLETLQRETRADIVRLGEKPVRGQPRGERCRPAGGQGQGPADPEGLPFPSPSALTARFRAIARPLPYGRGSDQSRDRKGALAAGNSTISRGQRPSSQKRRKGQPPKDSPHAY